MLPKILTICAILSILFAPLPCLAGNSEVTDSSYWSKLAHEENSVVASVLYIPYLLGQIPVRIIDALVNPKPASQATIPPAAHKVPAQ
jgi:hypothetical protein